MRYTCTKKASSHTSSICMNGNALLLSLIATEQVLVDVKDADGLVACILEVLGLPKQRQAFHQLQHSRLNHLAMGGFEARQCIGKNNVTTDLLQRLLSVERSCPRAFGIDSGHGHDGALVPHDVSGFSTILHERLPDNPGVAQFLRSPHIFMDTSTPSSVER